MSLFGDNSWRRKNQEMPFGNICTCNSPLKTSIYCEQAFRVCLMWQLVGLSTNYSLLSHRNVWQYISFLAIVQLVKKKKINITPTQQNLLTFVKIKMLRGDASDSVEAANRYSLPGPLCLMKRSVAAPLPCAASQLSSWPSAPWYSSCKIYPGKLKVWMGIMSLIA